MPRPFSFHSHPAYSSSTLHPICTNVTLLFQNFHLRYEFDVFCFQFNPRYAVASLIFHRTQTSTQEFAQKFLIWSWFLHVHYYSIMSLEMRGDVIDALLRFSFSAITVYHITIPRQHLILFHFQASLLTSIKSYVAKTFEMSSST